MLVGISEQGTLGDADWNLLVGVFQTLSGEKDTALTLLQIVGISAMAFISVGSCRLLALITIDNFTIIIFNLYKAYY